MAENHSEYVSPNASGGWRVGGTRVSLDSVVQGYWAGRLPEAIAADFPSLTLEQVYGAIAFYLRHRAEVDRFLSDQGLRWEQFRRDSEARHSPLLQRVRRTAGQSASAEGKS